MMEPDREPRLMKTISMMQFIQNGERIPLGYGYAWQCWQRDAFVVMPIPLNIIVQIARWIWFTSMQPIVIDALAKAEHAGYERGHRHGSEHGKRSERVRWESLIGSLIK